MYEGASNVFRRILGSLDRNFDRIYGSRFNPLYQSGTLAVSLLILTVATGIYLLFWYSLSSPFESMQNIENQFLWARWVRNLHRYASDLSVVVVVFHVFRMFAEKKTWGPRLLAWMTGTVLAFLMFVVGWTGFILVWDQQAQALAAAGAALLGVIPFLGEAINRSVSGVIPVGSSFFFMNLFLHMSIPLIMVAVLWLHTSKLNEPAWLAHKKVFFTLSAFLVVFSFLKSAPLDGPADLLTLDQKYFLNLFYGFVIPFVHAAGPLPSFLIFSGGLALFFFVPLYWRPKTSTIQAAKHNQMACTGCQQCELDCPFDSIDMVARTAGSGSEKVASVNALSCVGCGICSASCSQLAIGPEDKSSRLQMQKIKELKGKFPQGSELVIHCERNPLGHQYVERARQQPASLALDCTGNLHVATAHYALGHFGKVQVIACAPHACVNRLGQERLVQRFLEKRPPEAPALMDFSKVQIFSGGVCDFDELVAKFNGALVKAPIWIQRIKVGAFTFFILVVVSWMSSIPFQRMVDYSALRVAIRLPAQATEVCRERTEEELAKLPLHMRNAKECLRTVLTYQLRISVDGKPLVDQVLTASGVRGDKPILFESELRVSPGRHEVSVQLSPLSDASEGVLRFSEIYGEEFVSGRAMLLTFNSNTKSLFLSRSAL